MTTRGEALGASLVALLITTAPGLAGMLGQAVTGVSDLPTSSATPGSRGDAPAWQVHLSPPRADRSRALRRGIPAGHGKAEGESSGRPTDPAQRLSVTAYCATGHRTASGVWPRVGMAAGPWPFGTRLHVEGVGTVVVTDHYGWGTQLDIFQATCAAARQFGRRELAVEVER